MVVLMTACLYQSEQESQTMKEHVDIVRCTDVPLIWVNAHCDKDQLKERVSSRERRSDTATKLADWGILSELIEGNELIRPTKYPEMAAELSLETVGIDVSGELEDAVERVKDLINHQE